MHIYLGTAKSLITPTEEVITKPSISFSNPGFTGCYNIKETSFSNARKL